MYENNTPLISVIFKSIHPFLKIEEKKTIISYFSFDIQAYTDHKNISRSEIFNVLLKGRLKGEYLKIKTRLTDMGYEYKFHIPIDFKTILCTQMASDIVKVFKEAMNE